MYNNEEERIMPVFKNLAKFVSYEEKTYSGGSTLAITYTSPNNPDPKKEFKVSRFQSLLDEDTINKIVELSPGDMITVHSQKGDTGYSELVKVSGPEDADKPKQQQGAQYKNKSGGNWPPKDETGIAVGAAWTNALQLLTHNLKDAQIDVTDVAMVAKEILKLKLAQEEELRATKKAGAAAEAKKELTPLEKAKQRAQEASKQQKEETPAPEAKPKTTKKAETKDTAPLDDVADEWDEDA